MADKRTLSDVVRDWHLDGSRGLDYRAMLEPPAFVQERMATELARARLAAATGRSLPAASQEVERRQALGMKERAAIESVYADVAEGRWTP